MPISSLTCHEIQSAVSQEEANDVILLRGKLHGRARKVLQNRKFTSIKQFIDRLKTSFRETFSILTWNSRNFASNDGKV